MSPIPPVLFGIGTLLVALGVGAIYLPAAPIFIGIVLIILAVGLATSKPIK